MKKAVWFVFLRLIAVVACVALAAYLYSIHLQSVVGDYVGRAGVVAAPETVLAPGTEDDQQTEAETEGEAEAEPETEAEGEGETEADPETAE